MGETEEEIRGGGEIAERGVTGGCVGSSGRECVEGAVCDAMLLRDMMEGGRQLPNTASPKADAVGEGMEYSETETDIDGRPDGSDSVMEGRAPLISKSVSMGVLNDMSSLEQRDSLSVRDRVAVVNEGMPSSPLNSGEIPRTGRGGGERDTLACSPTWSSTPDRPGVEVAFRTV